MADNRPTKKAEWSARERKIWELRTQGWTQQRIADECEVDVSTVNKALKRCYDKHYNEFMADIHEYKKQQAAEITAAAVNALEQYVKSQKKKMIVTQSGKTNDEGKFLKGAIKTVQAIDQVGDSKLLAMYFKGMEEVRKIWGIGAEASGGKGAGKMDASAMTVEEKVALFCSIPIEDRLKLLDSMITQKPLHDSSTHAVESDEA